MDAPKQHASNCKWARPTLQEPAPLWLEAEERPWTCERGLDPRVLETTESCAECPHWAEKDVAQTYGAN